MRNRLLLRIFIVALASDANRSPSLDPHAGGAVALFSGACFERRVVVLHSLAAMFVGARDRLSLAVPVIYGTFALVVCFGSVRDRRKSPLAVGAGAVASATFSTRHYFAWLMLGRSHGRSSGIVACT